MFDLLREYASQYHKINLPGIGAVGLEKLPARADFSDKMFYPPGEEWKLLGNEEVMDDSFINFICSKKNMAVTVAEEEWGKFCSDIRTKINNSGEIKLPGIGILKNDSNGVLQMETLMADTILLKPVIAERVIRKDAEHTILVGDREKTNFQMSELLNSNVSSANAKWWAWAAALFVFAAGLIVYNFSENKWSSKAIGNQHIIAPQPLPVDISVMFK